MSQIPDILHKPMKKAVHLEWWTLFWQATIVVVMALVMGSSEAMKSAWIEDILGLVPAAVFLLSVHFEKKSPTQKYPFGFVRMNSVAFAVSAAALVLLALYLIYDSGMKLVHMEHPTIGTFSLFGHEIWMGWVMIAALIYSVIPPVILGRIKQPVAETLADKVLHTDALMQKADWMTGVAAVFGILGVGFGLWWADSVAAILIAFDIAHDGVRALKIAIAELIDGVPRKLGSDKLAEDADAVRKTLNERYPEANIRLRETGRYIVAEVHGAKSPPQHAKAREFWPGDPDRAWRLAVVVFDPAG